MTEKKIKVQETIKEISQELHPKNRNGENEKRIRKKCVGCCGNFTCYKSQNYDYCKGCSVNGSRYSQNKCPECGDGSGLIKFPHQPPRSCKVCYLAQQEPRKENILTKHE